MVEFSLHVKTDFSANAEQIMIERGLILDLSGQEGFSSGPVAFLFQGDPRHWIVCSHKPDHDVNGRFGVSALPKRHYSISNARDVLDRSLS